MIHIADFVEEGFDTIDLRQTLLPFQFFLLLFVALGAFYAASVWPLTVIILSFVCATTRCFDMTQ